MQGLDSERRIRPAIDRGSVPACPMGRHTRVDPLSRKEEPRPRAQVGRRVPEASTTPVAGDDLAIEDEPSTERSERPFEVARGERIAEYVTVMLKRQAL